MKKYIFIISLILFFGMLPAAKSEGASLYLSPASGEYPVSSSFSVSVNVNSAGSAINVIDAAITYPADLLEVTSVSKNGSILKLWTKEPAFSNSSGAVSFSGGITAPGFTGTGTGLVINFIAKKEGNAQVSFSSGAALAADGKGTNVLSSKSGAIYSIKKKETIVEPKKPTKPKKEEPALAEIYSATHPDQNQWYNNPNPAFEWKVSSDLTGESAEFNQNPSAVPDLISEGLFDSKSYDSIKDGIWYFHLRVKNNNGWSGTSSFKVQIDTSPPNDFEIRIDDAGDKTNPRPALYFEATDDLSGISHYDIKIGGDYFSSATPSEINPFILPLQLPGSREIIITAIDKSGNRKDSIATADIKSIQTPEITVYPLIYNAGEEVMHIEGRSSLNVIIILNFEKDGKIVKAWEITSDEYGSWNFSTEELFKEGIYKLSAKVKDARGAISNSSQAKEIKVLLSGVAIGPFLISFWQLALVLVLVIIIFIIILFIILHRIKKEKKAINKEVKEAEESLKTTFDSLRDNLEKRIETFDYRDGLSPREKKIRDDVFKILESSENFIRKEIEDIEKEI